MSDENSGTLKKIERNALHLDLYTFLSCKVRGIELERDGVGGQTDRQTDRKAALAGMIF